MKPDTTLKNFMQEQFCFEFLVEIGLFTEEMRNDYQAQAKKLCWFFGWKSVYEYRSKPVRCHLTLDSRSSVNESGELKAEPFVTEVKSIWKE